MPVVGTRNYLSLHVFGRYGEQGEDEDKGEIAAMFEVCDLGELRVYVTER